MAVVVAVEDGGALGARVVDSAGVGANMAPGCKEDGARPVAKLEADGVGATTRN